MLANSTVFQTISNMAQAQIDSSIKRDTPESDDTDPKNLIDVCLELTLEEKRVWETIKGFSDLLNFESERFKEMIRLKEKINDSMHDLERELKAEAAFVLEFTNAVESIGYVRLQ